MYFVYSYKDGYENNGNTIMECKILYWGSVGLILTTWVAWMHLGIEF